LPASPSTSVARTTTTGRGAAPGEVVQTARAEFARLAVYAQPNDPAPSRVLDNPWKVPGTPAVKIPQVLLVESRRTDGWVQVLLPTSPRAQSGWVRAFDVRLTRVPYRIHIDRGQRRMTVLDRARVIYRGPIAVTAASRGVHPGHYYLRRVVSLPRSRMTASPYVYGLVPQLSSRLPLGTPVDVA
jgi:hypothetical protein